MSMCEEINYHLNCLITSRIIQSSSYKFITSMPIDFSFRLKYYSDLDEPLSIFKSRIRSLWFETTFLTDLSFNPLTANPNLCPKRTKLSPSLQQSTQVFSSTPSELQTNGPSSTSAVCAVLRAERVLPLSCPISMISICLFSQLGPIFLISNFMEKTFPTSIVSFLLVYLTITSYCLSTLANEPFLCGIVSYLMFYNIISAYSAGLKCLRQRFFNLETYLWPYSSLPTPLQIAHNSIICIDLTAFAPQQLQQMQNSPGRMNLAICCDFEASSASRDMIDELFLSDSATIETSFNMLISAESFLACSLTEESPSLAAAASRLARSVTSLSWQKQRSASMWGNRCFISWWTCCRVRVECASLQSLSLNCTFTVSGIQ